MKFDHHIDGSLSALSLMTLWLYAARGTFLIRSIVQWRQQFRSCEGRHFQVLRGESDTLSANAGFCLRVRNVVGPVGKAGEQEAGTSHRRPYREKTPTRPATNTPYMR